MKDINFDNSRSTECNKLKEKYSRFKYALSLLDSETIEQRRLGYALLAPIFRSLPEKVKEFVRYLWQNENDIEKRRIPFMFVKKCEMIFSS